MKSTLKLQLSLLILGLMLAAAVFAQVPQLINYQGLLIDPVTGKPKPNGTYTMVFAIYNTLSGGNAIWTETQNVQTNKGLYNVMLGSVTPLTTAILNGPEKYLGIKVEADAEMTPRKRIVSVAYAIISGEADKLDGKEAADFAAKSELSTSDGNPPNQGSNLVSWDNLKDVPAGFADGVDNGGTGGGGNTLDQAYDQGGPGAGRTIIADAGAVNITNRGGLTVEGRVGIGTTDPAAQLDVRGDIGIIEHGKLISTAPDSEEAFIQLRNIADGNMNLNTAKVNGVKRDFLISSGNVGVGTTSPILPLQVSKAGPYGQPALGVMAGANAWAYLFADNIYDNAIIWDLNRALRFGTESSVGNGWSEKVRITKDGKVGIGTTSPNQKLEINGGNQEAGLRLAWGSQHATLWGEIRRATSGGLIINSNAGGGTWADIHLQTNAQTKLFVQSDGKVGIGTTSPGANLHIAGAENSGTTASLKISSGAQNMLLDGNEIDGVDNGLFLNNNTDQHVILASGGGRVGIGTTTPTERLEVNGNAKVKVLQITGGADLSEQFEVQGAPNTGGDELRAEPGMVVCIDANNPGKLMVSSQAYDRRVAGIVSGAGGVKPGMLLGQDHSIAQGSTPVALSGRVYCWAEASNGAINPGDLLTTSNTAGHAMKVTDHAKAQGAIIGKAMSSLKEAKGLVLVLVSLQ